MTVVRQLRGWPVNEHVKKVSVPTGTLSVRCEGKINKWSDDKGTKRAYLYSFVAIEIEKLDTPLPVTMQLFAW